MVESKTKLTGHARDEVVCSQLTAMVQFDHLEINNDCRDF